MINLKNINHMNPKNSIFGHIVKMINFFGSIIVPILGIIVSIDFFFEVDFDIRYDQIALLISAALYLKQSAE